MNIKTQVNGALGTILSLLIIISVGGYLSVSIVKQAGETHPQILIPGIQSYASLRYASLETVLAVYQKDSETITRIANEHSEAMTLFGSKAESDSPFYGDAYLDDGVYDISQAMLEVVNLALKEDLNTPPSEQFKAAAGKLNGIETQANDIIQYIIDQTTNLIDEAISMIIKILLWVALLAIAISFTMSIILTRRMTLSINSLRTSFKLISEGDLTTSADDSRNDEFAEIASYFNVLATDLKSTISQLSQMMNTLSTLSSRFRISGEQFRDRAQQTSEETQQVATAMTEMAATIREVAQNAELTSNQAQDANSQTSAAREQVGKSVVTSQTLEGKMGKISSQIGDLKGKTESISSVIDVIQGIAEQTNLLALNAAIEAARAGEQGRGFAVVADEVRSLATRTGESTQEIIDVIQSLQSMAEKTVQQVEEGQHDVELNARSISEIEQSLTSILSNISSISEMNHQVATNSQEQSHVAEDMNSNVVRISDLSEQNAAQTDQITQDIQTIDDLTQQVNQLIKKFSY